MVQAFCNSLVLDTILRCHRVYVVLGGVRMQLRRLIQTVF